MSVILTKRDKTSRINWVTVIFMGLFHLGAVAAFFVFSWQAVAVAAVLFYISMSLGIGMGYHRLLTHRSYKTPKLVEYFLAVCGSLALEGGPLFWVATHRVHHQYSDQEGDPHTPRDGGWWAHAGWIVFGESNHSNTKLMSRYAPDMAKEPFYIWLNSYHYVPLTVLGLALLAFGGWSMLLWGVCVRIVLGLHATWLVNSATHMWGGRRFATRDDSRNNWWVALLTFGEGWHNNHHAHPTSARHGLAWYELDLTWLGIWLLERLGLVTSVKVAKINHPAEQREAA